MVAFIVAAIMLYSPYIWCYKKSEALSDYGLIWTLTRKSIIESLLCLLITLLPLTIIAINWPGDYLPRTISLTTAFKFLSAGIVAAIVEETFFRGFIQTLLDRKLHYIVAIMITSFIFALSHLFIAIHWLRLATFFPGVIMGLLRYRHGSIAPSIIYHIGGNIWSVWFFPNLT